MKYMASLKTLMIVGLKQLGQSEGLEVQQKGRGLEVQHTTFFAATMKLLLKVVKHDDITKRKRFCGCSHWPKTCRFSKWADECDDVHELQQLVFEKDTQIAELEMQKEMLEEKIRRPKEKKHNLHEEAIELAMDNSEVMVAISSRKADKKLTDALVLFWVFFAAMLVLY